MYFGNWAELRHSRQERDGGQQQQHHGWQRDVLAALALAWLQVLQEPSMALMACAYVSAALPSPETARPV